MARRGGGGGNPMGVLTAVAIGALIFIAILMFVPYVAGTIEESMPALGASSNWNATYNTDLPEPSETWTTVAALLTLCAVVLVISIAIMYFKGML